ncbi:MAG TPA: hypothetical protein VF185_00280 [Patescibacteria group bacterium]
MENQNNQPNQNTNNPVMPSNPQGPTLNSMPQPNPQEKIKSLVDKVKSSQAMSNFSNKFSAFTPSQKRLLKVGGGVFAFAIVLLLLASIIKSIKPQAPKATPTPTPQASTPLPTPVGIGIPSRYATDSAVLKIDEDVKSLQTKLEATDLEESNLRPPDINFFVSFTP